MEKLKKAFRMALLKEMSDTKTKKYILNTVKKRLGHFPEYKSADETAQKCMSHIFEVVDKQLNDSDGYSNRERFLNQKLIKMQVQKGYVKTYIMIAANTYCTAKQVKCNPGRKAIYDKEGNLIAKEKKRGLASRIIDGQDKLAWMVSSDSIGLSNISNDSIIETESFLKKLHLNDKEIRCFWDRLDGETFVDMAKEYQEGNVKKEKSAPDLYRKRYQRLMKKIGNKKEKVFDIMTRDSHLFQNHALSDN